MTDKDWADEIALELKRTGHLGAKPVAAALRKAKAAGMQYATTYLKTAYDAKERGEEFDMGKLYEALFAKISKLHPPA